MEELRQFGRIAAVIGIIVGFLTILATCLYCSYDTILTLATISIVILSTSIIILFILIYRK